MKSDRTSWFRFIVKVIKVSLIIRDMGSVVLYKTQCAFMVHQLHRKQPSFQTCKIIRNVFVISAEMKSRLKLHAYIIFIYHTNFQNLIVIYITTSFHGNIAQLHQFTHLLWLYILVEKQINLRRNGIFLEQSCTLTLTF